MSGKKRIAVVGSSGHAKVVTDIIEREGRYELAGFIDPDRPVGEEVLGHRVLGREEDLEDLQAREGIGGVVVAIGDNFVRSRVAGRIRNSCPSLSFETAIHPAAAVAEDVPIGEGTVVMAGATVNPGSSIGRLCILNTNASLDHDSTMDDFSSLAPGVTTGGNCRIGAYAAVGIGATLVHDVSVGEHTVVGAGATVLKDLEAFRVAYGIPARVVRERRPGDRYL